MKKSLFLCALLCTTLSINSIPLGDLEGHPHEESADQASQQSVACSYPVTYKTGYLVGIDQPIRLIIPAYLMPSECTYNALVDFSLQDKLDQRGFEISGFDAFGSMIQGEEASEALSESGGLFPYMPFLQPIHYQETEGDDMSKLGYLGTFIKNNPSRSFQVGLYFQFWKRNASANHAWIIFHREARAEDPQKRFQDIYAAVNPKKVKNFKNLLPFLETVEYANHPWIVHVMKKNANYKKLKKHPLASYFSFFMHSKIQNGFSGLCSQAIFKENSHTWEAHFYKALLIKEEILLNHADGSPDDDAAIKCMWKAWDINRNPWILEDFVLSLYIDLVNAWKKHPNRVKLNYANRVKLIHELAEEFMEAGSAKASYIITDQYRLGLIPPEKNFSPQQVMKRRAVYLARASFQQHEKARFELANMYLDGKIGKTPEGEVNYKEAGKRFLELAEEGDAESQYLYGLMIKKQWILLDESKKSYMQQAALWLKKAANQNHAVANALLGKLYIEGKIGLLPNGQPDYSRGAYYLDRDYTLGGFVSALILGDLIMKGNVEKLSERTWVCSRGSEQSLLAAQAAPYYYRAAEAGISQAQEAYGNLLEEGYIRKDLTKFQRDKLAAEWYWRSALRKNVSAYEHFIDLYRFDPIWIGHHLQNSGFSIPETLDSDVPWLFEAWQKGKNFNARRVLFLLVRQKKVSDTSFIAAHYEQAIAARNGDDFKVAFSGFLPHAIYLENPKAMHNIGMILYKKGDLLSAKQWFEAASGHGLEASKRNLERIASELKTKTPPFVMRVYFNKEGDELSFNNAGFHINTGDKLEAYKDKSDFEILQGIALSRDPGVKFDYDLLSHGALIYFY